MGLRAVKLLLSQGHHVHQEGNQAHLGMEDSHLPLEVVVVVVVEVSLAVMIVTVKRVRDFTVPTPDFQDESIRVAVVVVVTVKKFQTFVEYFSLDFVKIILTQRMHL